LDNRSIKNVLDVNGSFDRFGFRTVSRTKGLWYSSGLWIWIPVRVGKALVLLVGYWIWILDLKRIQKELEKRKLTDIGF
jgi:hypothetical protein